MKDIWRGLKRELICPKNKWNILARNVTILAWFYLALDTIFPKLPEIIKLNSHLVIEMF